MSDRIHWCNAHNRHATHNGRHGPCCDPKLGGIMIPCVVAGVVDITDILEITDER